MKTIFRLVALSIGLLAGTNALMAQDYIRETDRQTGHPLLHGEITFADLLDETTCAWLGSGATNYRGDADAIAGIKQLQSNYRFVLFVGTWCEDTQI
ncbi:MAG: hypothetical protein FGM54_09800, partial [Chitinophagaceae bacterium]|nr:hypothetical protein [Chitinophagaceae bacterium]